MEANYMKDYVCCDIRLDTMHELLQHYEETHSAQRVQKTVRTPHGHQYPSSRAANVQAQAVPQDLPAASHQQRQTIPQQPTFHHYQPHFSRPSSNHAYPTPTNMDYAATMPTDWQFQFQEAAAFQAQQQAQQQQQQQQQVQNR
jgi:transcription factor SFP1